MAAFETDYYEPVHERLRLWYMEKQPEIELKFKEMKRDNNARLGQRIRDVLRQTPGDFQTVLDLCVGAEAEEVTLAQLMSEGVEAEAARLRTTFLNIAVDYPGDSDPTAEVRERIKRKPDPNATAYCSPILVETLFWEGLDDHLPNAHRKMLEWDFPARIEALLDFHCVAFHADINVLKELYDEDVRDKAQTKLKLNMHREKMEAVMAKFAEEMKNMWAEQNERLRSKPAPTATAERQTANDWIFGVPSPKSDGGVGGEARRRAHMTDPPTMLGPIGRNSNKAHRAVPPRGILKNKLASTSVVPDNSSAAFTPLDETVIRLRVPVRELGFDEEEVPDSFVLGELIGSEDAEDELGGNAAYAGPEIVLASHSRTRYASTPSPVYETFRPSTPSDDETLVATPRAVRNVARLTQQFEERVDKGKARIVN